MHFFLLNAKYKIETEYTPQEVKAVLQKNLARKWKNRGSKLFVGKVKEDTFKIILRQETRNSFRPVLYGRIIEKPKGGSTVKVQARLMPIIKGFSIVWLSGVLLFLQVGIVQVIQEDSPELMLAAICFLIFYFALSTIGFRSAEREARKRLISLLKK